MTVYGMHIIALTLTHAISLIVLDPQHGSLCGVNNGYRICVKVVIIKKKEKIRVHATEESSLPSLCT
jgi:hypothetical protein